MDIIERAENHQDIQSGIKANQNGHYQSLSKGHFWYRIENEYGSLEGVLTGVQVASKSNNITTHEAVLEKE